MHPESKSISPCKTFILFYITILIPKYISFHYSLLASHILSLGVAKAASQETGAEAKHHLQRCKSDVLRQVLAAAISESDITSRGTRPFAARASTQHEDACAARLNLFCVVVLLRDCNRELVKSIQIVKKRQI